MANFTPNYNLKKPLGSENYNVADQNGNMDAIDTALNGIDNGLAIVSTGNTHAAVTAGQYVYVRRHGSLAEGLYKANSNIAANATLTSSNLSSVSGGLGGEVSSLNSKFAKYSESKKIWSGTLALTNTNQDITLNVSNRNYYDYYIVKCYYGSILCDGVLPNYQNDEGKVWIGNKQINFHYSTDTDKMNVNSPDTDLTLKSIIGIRVGE